MKTKRFVGLLSILILACLIPAPAIADPGTAGTIGSEKNTKAVSDKLQSKPAGDTLNAPSAAKHQVVVYYFYTTQRCSSCLKIEAYTKEAIDSAYSAQLKDSLIVWRMTNIDEKANEHYQDDYQLYTKSVIVSDMVGGKQIRWKNLEKIWEYLDDKAAFQAYIKTGIDSYLKAE
jgi:hypothetical protein